MDGNKNKGEGKPRIGETWTHRETSADHFVGSVGMPDGIGFGAMAHADALEVFTFCWSKMTAWGGPLTDFLEEFGPVKEG